LDIYPVEQVLWNNNDVAVFGVCDSSVVSFCNLFLEKKTVRKAPSFSPDLDFNALRYTNITTGTWMIGK
jgi:hypothetical protein